MNYADFNTQPDGFPLESDATLGFMQSNYQDTIRALAKLAGADNIIITGVEDTGGSVSEGWILHDGDLVYFEAGTKSTYFIIEEVATQKANSNGALVDRYFTKVAKFGTGPDQVAFSVLTRINHLEALGNYIQYIASGGRFGATTDDWVVLNGLEPQGSPAGDDGISAGIVIRYGHIFSVPAYGSPVSAGSPAYLTPDNTWTGSSDPNYLKFDPYTSRRLTAVYRKNQAPSGQIIWIDDDIDDISDRFDGSGLGLWEWTGWAIANGNNGTTDRTALLSGLTPIVKL